MQGRAMVACAFYSIQNPNSKFENQIIPPSVPTFSPSATFPLHLYRVLIHSNPHSAIETLCHPFSDFCLL